VVYEGLEVVNSLNSQDMIHVNGLTIDFPYYSFGEVCSDDLFSDYEVEIFEFYRRNRKRYKNVLDIGANIGLHSIILGKLGYYVFAYEPDPVLCNELCSRVHANGVTTVLMVNAAVSDHEGCGRFVRINGNTTAGHLEGMKECVYGKTEEFNVQVEDIKNIVNWADLIKIDAEGSEVDILLGIDEPHWYTTDAIVEISNLENAVEIYKHFKSIGVNMFSYKNRWKKVMLLVDMPKHYSEGMVFISKKRKMP